MMANVRTESDSIRFYELHRWLNPFQEHRFELVSPLDPLEIASAVRPYLWERDRVSHEDNVFLGTSTPTHLDLQRFGPPQPTKPTLSVELEDIRSGTIPIAKLRLHPQDALVVALLTPILAAISVFMLFRAMISGAGPIGTVVLIGTLPIFIAFLIDRWTARSEHDFYRRFLARVLQARDLESGL